MLAAQAMRTFERLNERSVAADTALRDAYRLLPSIDRTISLKAKDGDLMVISPDGRFIAVERAKGMDLIATKERRRRRVSFDGLPADALRLIVFSADGSTTAPIPAEWVAASSDGDTLAIAAGRRITIRDRWRSAHVHDTTLSHPSPIRSMAFDRDASRFVAATVDGRLFVWHWRGDAHTPWRRFAHGEFVTSVTFAGDFIVTTGGNAAKVWDLRRAASDRVAVLQGDARVWSTAIEPRENVLAMVSADGLLQLWNDWNTAAPREIVRLRLGAAPPRDALQVAFTGDGRYLVSRSESGLEARLWRPSDLLAATCTRLRRNVADDVWARTCR